MNAVVEIKNGRPMTTSVIVAQSFEKQHFHVIRDIDKLLEMEPNLCASNFGCTWNEVPGPRGGVRKERMYTIDRDGFALLAMGFTGPKALKWKLKYIEAFNKMEAALAGRAPKPIDRPFQPILEEVQIINAHTSLVAEVRRTIGRSAARKVYQMTSLPQVERSDPDFYPEPCIKPEDDGLGALKHLLQQAAGNGQTLGSVIRAAFTDEIAARNIERMGLRVINDKKQPRFAVAEKHDRLADMFAETPWVDDWATALNGLDRAAIRLTSIGGAQVRAVHLPKGMLP